MPGFLPTVLLAATATTQVAPPMTFEISPYGGEIGRDYIVASGRITRETPGRFTAFLSEHPAERATIILDSNGGDLRAALALGREIRSRGYDTALTRSETAPPEPVIPSERPRGSAAPHDPAPSDVAAAFVRVFENLLDANRAQLFRVRPTRCLSACVYMFLGGVSRELSHISALTGDQNHDGAGQEQLGFHQFRLNLATEAGVEDRNFANAAGEAGAQVLSAELVAYLTEMGISLRVLDFANDAELLPDLSQRLNFPSIAELGEAGVLIQGSYSPFALVPQRTGIALVSRYSHTLSHHRQVSLLCARTPGQQERMILLVSLWRDRGRQLGPPPRLDLDDLGRPSPPDSSRDNLPDWFRLRFDWAIRVSVDGSPIATADHNSGVEYNGTNSRIPLEGEVNHWAVTLDGEAVAAISRGRRLGIDLGALMSIWGMAIPIDDLARDALRLLPQNCVEIPPVPPRGEGTTF